MSPPPVVRDGSESMVGERLRVIARICGRELSFGPNDRADFIQTTRSASCYGCAPQCSELVDDRLTYELLEILLNLELELLQHQHRGQLLGTVVPGHRAKGTLPAERTV